MNIPPQFDIKDGKQYNNKDHALKFHNNIYDQKQSGRVWSKFLVAKLKTVGLKKYKIGPCLFYKGRVLYLIYTDDSILAAPTTQEIEE